MVLTVGCMPLHPLPPQPCTSHTPLPQGITEKYSGEDGVLHYGIFQSSDESGFMGTKQEQGVWEYSNFIDALRVTPSYDSVQNAKGRPDFSSEKLACPHAARPII